MKITKINNHLPVPVTRNGPDRIRALINTKARNAIYRPRLSIEDGSSPRVCLYRAPPGYGKTVALAFEWLRHSNAGNHAVWISLKANIYSESDICTEIIGQLEAFEPLQFSDVRNNEHKPLLLQDLASSLWQSNFGNETDILICLDNINHSLELPLLQALMAFMVDTPERVRFAVAGNTIKGFSQLRLAGTIQEYSEKELAFTSGEAAALAEAKDVPGMSEVQIEDLVQEVEGWPALIGFMLKHGLPESSISAIVEIDNFLNDEIFETLSEQYRTFLENCSLLDFITPEKYNYVFKCVNAASFIKFFSADYILFRQVKDESGKLTLHPILRDFLQGNTWTENPAKRSYLLKRAAFWHWRRSEYQYAIRTALQANDSRWAVGISEEIILDLSFRQGEIDTLRQWLSEIPVKRLHKHPIILIGYAWVLCFSHQGKLAEKLIKDLVANTDKKELKEKGWPQLVFAIGQAIQDEMFSSEELCNQWINLFGDSNAVGKGAALTCLAFIFASEHRFSELENILTQAQAVNKFARQSFASGWLFVAKLQQALASGKMAWTKQIITQARTDSNAQIMETAFISKMLDALELEPDYEVGCLDASEEKFSDILEFTCNHGVTDVFFSVIHVVSAWRLGRNELNGSIEILEWAREHASEKNLPRLEVLSQLEIYRRFLFKGVTYKNKFEARDDLRIFSGPHSDPLRARFLLVRSLEFSSEQNFQLAAHRALLAIQQAREICAGQLEVRGLINLAGAQAGDGALKKAQRNIAYALEMAKHLQCFQTILDEIRLVKRIIPISKETFEAFNLDQAIDACVIPKIAETGKAEESNSGYCLTPKQISVLRFVKEGYSNKQIAINLYVTEDAIKWHMRKIFSVLHVKCRTQAVIEAQRQGVI